MRRTRTACRRRNKRRSETKSSTKGAGCLISTCAKKRRTRARGKEGPEKRRGTGTKCICVNPWWKQPRARETKKDTGVYGRPECVTERKRAEITGASVWRVVCEKKIARKRGTDEGCHRIPRIYERKQGTRNRMAAGGHMEGRETPERKSQPAGRGGKMRKRDRGTPGEAREEENVRAVGCGRGRETGGRGSGAR